MRCEEIKGLILEYEDGDLDEGERERIESHLVECEDCSVFFKRSNEVWRLLDRWEAIEPRGDIVARFWDRVSEEDRKGRGIFDLLKNPKPGWTLGAALAVILIIGVVTFDIIQPNRAQVVFTEEDRADEELLIRVDNAVSRETANSLSIYGPWDEEDTKGNNKGG
jgi:predicted anti-sigma-YlaC factor YlaD